MTAVTVMMSRSFLEAHGRLPIQDQAQVSNFLFKLMQNPAQPGLSMERVDRAPQPQIWSARVSRGIRCILHRHGGAFTLLYVGREEEAYRWAERRRVERHPVTGALQIVETTDVIEQRIAAAQAARDEPQAPPLFAAYDDRFLLSLGVPEDWLPVIRKIGSEDMLLEACTSLPAEAAERLLDLATGGAVTSIAAIAPDRSALDHADSLRRFAVVTDEDELRRMLAAPLALWTTFLHPSQRSLVEGVFRGPAKVTGSAGTGKTVVAMHRARHLARQGRRVLLTTFSRELGNVIDRNLALLCTAEERSRITVSNVHRFVTQSILRPAQVDVQPPDDNQITNLIARFHRELGFPSSPSPATLASEWTQVIQAQGITTWEQYRTASRAGRGTALSATERRRWWEVFERVHAALAHERKLDWPALCARGLETIAARLAERDAARARWEAEAAALEERRAALQRELDRVERAAARAGQRSGLLGKLPTLFGGVETRYGAERRRLMAELTALEREQAALERRRPAPAARPLWDFDAVIVDEVQDLGPQEIRLLAAIAGPGTDRLMLIGDGGQRIYAPRLSLRALGIEVRGRSRTLTINYRTTEQIRRCADRVVDEQGDDLDGGREPRRACRSLLRGPAPVFRGFASAAAQHDYIAAAIADLCAGGYAADEIAVLARARRLLESAAAALQRSGIAARFAGQPANDPAVVLSTLHRAKGMEFKAVFVVDVSAGEVPSPAALRGLEDPADIEDVHTRERQALYVALTRARDVLHVTWTGGPSPYLRDLLTAPDATALVSTV